MGDAKNDDLQVGLDSRLRLKFCGSKVTSDAGLLAYRELDEALGLTRMGADLLTDSRQGSNKQHLLIPLLRQSIYTRLAGYEDVNDATTHNLTNFRKRNNGTLRASAPCRHVPAHSPRLCIQVLGRNPRRFPQTRRAPLGESGEKLKKTGELSYCQYTETLIAQATAQTSPRFQAIPNELPPPRPRS